MICRLGSLLVSVVPIMSGTGSLPSALPSSEPVLVDPLQMC